MAVALITGGTRGIGFAVSKKLAARGYELIVTYRSNEEAARRASDELLALGAKDVSIIPLDITDEASPENLRAFVVERGVKIDALVLNAGITRRESFDEITLESWNEVFFANVHFPTLFIQKASRDLLAPGASITLTGSLMGIHPHAMSLSYGVTKATVHALTVNLVKFLSPLGFRVNAIAPGFVDTEWQKDKPAHIRESIESKIALGQFCDPDNVADAFLLAIDNSYLNGETIKIDGGYSFR